MLAARVQMVVEGAVALLLAVLLRGLGARVRRLAHIALRPGLAFAADFLAGAAALGAAVLLLGLLGRLTPPWLGLLVLLCAAAGRHRRLIHDLRPLGWPALAALPSLPIALAPPFFYDALVYHLGLPAQALLEGRIAARPEQLFATFPPLAQLLAVAPLAAGWERVPALLQLIAFVAAGAGVRALARALGADGLRATLAGMTLLLLPIAIPAAGLPAAEGYLVLSVAVSLALALSPSPRPDPAVWIGLLAGTGAAARLQGLVWCALALLALAARGRLRAVPAAALAAAFASLPWWGKNAILIGQPLAPIGWRREGIETLWRDGASHLVGGFASVLDPAGLWRALGPSLPFLLPLAVLALLACRDGERGRAPAALRVLGLGLVLLALLAWYATGSLGRFLLPVSALLLALAAAGPRRGRGLAVAVLGALAMVGALRAFAFAGRLGLGWPGREEGVAVRGRLVVSDPFPAFQAARALPAPARVLFVGEPRGFGFPRRFVAPSQHDVSPLREPLEQAAGVEPLRRWLMQEGFSHLLVNRAELARLESAYPVAPFRSEAGRVRFRALLAALGEPVVAAGGTEIYAIDVPPPAGAVR